MAASDVPERPWRTAADHARAIIQYAVFQDDPTDDEEQESDAEPSDDEYWSGDEHE